MWFALLLAGSASAQTTPNTDVLHALSMRHPVPCAEVEALSPTPVVSLLQVVDEVRHPAWAPMRAAECLIAGHAQEIRPQLERWVVKPEYQGLARIVLSELDRLPLGMAIPLARKALQEGPMPETARDYVLDSKVPAVKAVASEVVQ